MALVEFKLEKHIGTLTLNSPENLNAMTPAMGDALAAVIPQILAESNMRVLILRGAGRAFSAGGDFNFILSHCENSQAENESRMFNFYSKFLKILEIEVPIIAMIHGPAVGAGLLVALACDLRYAAQEAKMAINFAKIGLSSGMGGLYWLTQLTGPGVASDLLFRARSFEAEEAYRLGLIHQVFQKDQLESQIHQIAEEIAQNAPLPLKIMKKGIRYAATASLKEVLAYEAQGQAQCFASQDLQEGIRAIQEKRQALFSGK